MLTGWYSPAEKLWRIPLVKNVTKETDSVAVATPLTHLLRRNAPPPPENILSVYELKTQPELVRYYHAAAGFPTQPTWIKAIKNSHYATWPGLTARVVTKHFPESVETWRGHGRKIQANLRSTKKVLEQMDAAHVPAPYCTSDEGGTQETAAHLGDHPRQRKDGGQRYP